MAFGGVSPVPWGLGSALGGAGDDTWEPKVGGRLHAPPSRGPRRSRLSRGGHLLTPAGRRWTARGAGWHGPSSWGAPTYSLGFSRCPTLAPTPPLVGTFIFLRFYLFIFRERGKERREGKKHQCAVASHAPPTGDLACNPGMCPDWESKWQPFGSQAGAQSTEPHQPGVGTFLPFQPPDASEEGPGDRARGPPATSSGTRGCPCPLTCGGLGFLH